MILTATLEKYKYKNQFQASKALSIQHKKWKIIKITKWIYLTKDYKKEELYTISNILVQNSYISLETVLWLNWILTEIVSPTYISAITITRKPREYNTPVWTFVFRFINKELFYLRNGIDTRYATFYMATKEKALIDYLYFKSFYLKTKYKNEIDIINYLTELRLDLSEIDWKLYIYYLEQIRDVFKTDKWKIWLFKYMLEVLHKKKGQISFY